MHFRDKVIWITGASSGIGAEMARQLSAQGARLILTARNETAMRMLVATLDCDAVVLPADLSQQANIGDLVGKAVAAFGRIDVVIHSAGVSQRSLTEETDNDVYRRLMEINFFAPVAITQGLLPQFRVQRSGQIVAISSMAGLMGFPMRTGYAAAKHALKGFFETLQTEHSIPGLNITLVYPGRIYTPISLAALTGNGSAHGRMDNGQLQGIPVEACARKIVHAMKTKKQRVIIARGERLLWWLWFLTPGLYYRIARKKGLSH